MVLYGIAFVHMIYVCDFVLTLSAHVPMECHMDKAETSESRDMNLNLLAEEKPLITPALLHQV